jgi:hypothetical protein
MITQQQYSDFCDKHNTFADNVKEHNINLVDIEHYKDFPIKDLKFCLHVAGIDGWSGFHEYLSKNGFVISAASEAEIEASYTVINNLNSLPNTCDPELLLHYQNYWSTIVATYNEVEKHDSSNLVVVKNNGNSGNYSNQCFWIALSQALKLEVNVLRKRYKEECGGTLNGHNDMFIVYDDNIDQCHSLTRFANLFNVSIRIIERVGDSLDLRGAEDRQRIYDFGDNLNPGRDIWIAHTKNPDHFELVLKYLPVISMVNEQVSISNKPPTPTKPRIVRRMCVRPANIRLGSRRCIPKLPLDKKETTLKMHWGIVNQLSLSDDDKTILHESTEHASIKNDSMEEFIMSEQVSATTKSLPNIQKNPSLDKEETTLKFTEKSVKNRTKHWDETGIIIRESTGKHSNIKNDSTDNIIVYRPPIERILNGIPLWWFIAINIIIIYLVSSELFFVGNQIFTHAFMLYLKCPDKQYLIEQIIIRIPKVNIEWPIPSG